MTVLSLLCPWQVLERVLAELSMLQSSAQGQAGVSPLQLSKLDALLAQVRPAASLQ